MCGCENFPSHLILCCFFFSNGYLWFYPPFRLWSLHYMCCPDLSAGKSHKDLARGWKNAQNTHNLQNPDKTPKAFITIPHLVSCVSFIASPYLVCTHLPCVLSVFFFVYPQFSLPFPGHDLLTLHIAFGHISLIFRHYPPTYIYACHMFNYSLLVGSHKLDQRFIAEKLPLHPPELLE